MEFANKGLDPTTGSVASIWSPATGLMYPRIFLFPTMPMWRPQGPNARLERL